MAKNVDILRILVIVPAVLCGLCCSVFAQGVSYQGEHIKTVRMRYASVTSDGIQVMEGDPVRPFLVMANGQPIGADGDANGMVLEVSFDELSHETHLYTYTVQLLNGDASPNSALLSNEYVQGFTTQDVTIYEHSLNTSQLYTHYTFTFPNADMTLTKSGNYRLLVYEDGDQSKRVAEVDFCVVEPQVKITATVRPNTDIELNGRYQQVEVTVTGDGSRVTGTQMSDYFIVVRQNARTDNQVMKPKPTFIESNRLRYTNCRELIFEGGNEYRHFDTYSTYFAGTNVDRITHDHNDYHALLMSDAFRGTGALFAGERITDKCGTAYMHEFDVNGQFVVNAERTIYDIDTEAEYMWVHWTVPADNPWFDGSVYVGGDLFGNKLSAANRMQYDGERKCYWLTALVKQGGYDYHYWFVPADKSLVNSRSSLDYKKATLQRTEGSHWQTENEYTIYVYYRPFGSRYDRLVGLQVIR